MKRKEFRMYVLAALCLISVSLTSCHHQYYKTHTGKAKQKYYNEIQFGADSHPKKKF